MIKTRDVKRAIEESTSKNLVCALRKKSELERIFHAASINRMNQKREGE